MKKAIDKFSFVWKILGFAKTAFMFLILAIVEFANRRARHAEDRAAIAESDLKIHKLKDEIHDKNRDRDPADTIDEFINEDAGE